MGWVRMKPVFAAVVILGVVVLVPIAQWQIGRHMFEQECAIDEGAWAKPTDPVDSIAYDELEASSPGYMNGCDWPTCSGVLIGSHWRFIEVHVRRPRSELLSSESGWYRYWLAKRGDPSCAAFEASEEFRTKWLARITDPRFKNSPKSDVSELCIASKKIEGPASRYVFVVRDNVEKRHFGLLIRRHNLIDRTTGEVRNHFQSTSYRGPWLFEVTHWLLSHLSDGGLVPEICQLTPARYQKPMGGWLPKSSLDP